MDEAEIDEAVKIYLSSFRGMGSEATVRKWFECNFRAYPRMQYFTALADGRVVGYVLWMEKGGFRRESVWELEQIAVHPDFRRRRVATRLIKESLEAIRKYLNERTPRSKLKLVLVTSGVSNSVAHRLYRATLGAKPEAVIKDLYRADEAIYVARFLEASR